MTIEFASTAAIGLVAACALQGAIMCVDEFYCHMRRRVPSWERVGHPIDTFFFLACFVFALTTSPAAGREWIFVVLACVSTLMVTKDEFVHAGLCDGFEQFLHALLFILHPIVMISLGMLWSRGHLSPELGSPMRVFVAGQSSLIAGFLVYQVLFWNSSYFARWFAQWKSDNPKRLQQVALNLDVSRRKQATRR